jgi:hypothetical protein
MLAAVKWCLTEVSKPQFTTLQPDKRQFKYLDSYFFNLLLTIVKST